MNSSSEGSAHCTSSNTMITGSDSERRSKNSRHPANRSLLSGAVRSSSPIRWASRGSTNCWSSGAGTNCSTASWSLARAEARSSPSTMPARPRTISARAQYVTPSP